MTTHDRLTLPAQCPLTPSHRSTCMRIFRTVLTASILPFVAGSESRSSKDQEQLRPVVVPLEVTSAQAELMNELVPGSQAYLLKVGQRELAVIQLDKSGDPLSVMFWDKKQHVVVSLDAKDAVFPGSMTVSTDHAALERKSGVDVLTICDDDLDGLADRRYQWSQGKLIDRSCVKQIEWVDDLKEPERLPRTPVPRPRESRKTPTSAPAAVR